MIFSDAQQLKQIASLIERINQVHARGNFAECRILEIELISIIATYIIDQMILYGDTSGGTPRGFIDGD